MPPGQRAPSFGGSPSRSGGPGPRPGRGPRPGCTQTTRGLWLKWAARNRRERPGWSDPPSTQAEVDAEGVSVEDRIRQYQERQATDGEATRADRGPRFLDHEEERP
jgi:hypothetical protein